MWSAISTELLVADERSRPFISSMARGDLTWVGLDVHKDSIQMGILRRGSDAVEQRAIFHDEASVHKAFVRGLGPRSRLRVCDEAGPTGYGLARQLQQMGIACQVIAPSLIPKAPGDKVKTDRRDARRLSRLYRAGELVCTRIPTAQEDAVRDLCRARADMVEDRPGPETGSRSSCFATRSCGEAGRPGRSSTTAGSSLWPMTPRPSTGRPPVWVAA